LGSFDSVPAKFRSFSNSRVRWRIADNNIRALCDAIYQCRVESA